jgi:drug/metabolite transporter (DMT)-like permease
MLAHICVARALKLADAALVSPLQYTLLPWAVLLGWMFFGDVPTAAVLTGAAFIVVAGFLLLLPEGKPGRISTRAGTGSGTP